MIYKILFKQQNVKSGRGQELNDLQLQFAFFQEQWTVIKTIEIKFDLLTKNSRLRYSYTRCPYQFQLNFHMLKLPKWKLNHNTIEQKIIYSHYEFLVFLLFLHKDIFPDKPTERKILSYAIKCPSEGCHWKGELRNKEVILHLLKLTCNIQSLNRVGYQQSAQVEIFPDCFFPTKVNC